LYSAKTIEKFLGKDYTVKSSIGHIRDMPKKALKRDNRYQQDKKRKLCKRRAAIGLGLLLVLLL
jgi:DNA topoisomerase IA